MKEFWLRTYTISKFWTAVIRIGGPITYSASRHLEPLPT